MIELSKEQLEQKIFELEKENEELLLEISRLQNLIYIQSPHTVPTPSWDPETAYQQLQEQIILWKN